MQLAWTASSIYLELKIKTQISAVELQIFGELKEEILKTEMEKMRTKLRKSKRRRRRRRRRRERGH
jgi:hypothetical protein